MNNLKNLFLVALLLTNFAWGQSGEELKQQAFRAYKSGDYQTAFNLNEKACKAGDADGCNNLGVLYAQGQGVKQDYSKAKNLSI